VCKDRASALSTRKSFQRHLKKKHIIVKPVENNRKTYVISHTQSVFVRHVMWDIRYCYTKSVQVAPGVKELADVYEYRY